MDMVVVAAEPEGVTVVGLKAQVTPVGKPVHARVTTELKPLLGVMVTVAVAGDEFVSVPLAGVIDTEKSGAAALMVTVTKLDVEPENPLPPVYSAAIVCAPNERLEVVKIAAPDEFSVPEPMIAPPSVKFTDPDGVVEPETAATFAVKERLVPVVAVVAEGVRVVVVPTPVTVPTVIVTTGEVLPVKFVSPRYEAAIACAPGPSEPIEDVAFPDESVPVSRICAPSMILTVPVGFPAPPTAAETDAVNVTFVPGAIEVDEAFSDVVLGDSVTGEEP